MSQQPPPPWPPGPPPPPPPPLEVPPTPGVLAPPTPDDESPPQRFETPAPRDVEPAPPGAGVVAPQPPGGPDGPRPGAPSAARAFGRTPPAPRRSRRGVLIAAIVVLVALLAGGGGTAALLLTRSHATPTPTTPSASTAPSTSLEPTTAPIANGVAYTDPDKYWSARFDGTPTYHTAQQSTPVGQVPYLYAEFVGPGVDQVVGVLVFSPGTGFDAQKGLQGIADSSGGTVVSSSAATFQGYPSLQGLINLAGDYLKVQLVHVGNLAYIMGTAGAANPPSDFERFVATVRLAPH